ILSGSEVGLLHDFFGLEDSKSPLFYRHREEIPVERFNSEKALEFLRRGFYYHGIRPPEELLTRAVDEFDGIVGWLTYFGAEAVKVFKSGETQKLDEVFHDIRLKAVALSASELERLPARSMLYIGILAVVGIEGRGWAEIKRGLEGRFRRTVDGRQLTTLLHNLERLSYIRKDGALYRALDPISTEAAKLLISRRSHSYTP
ncbi:MAG: ATP-binding protein, partial [Aigarchaeota archaeon]|nr:ATP-binding protein [Candidatus Calditenuaceae archaeon]